MISNSEREGYLGPTEAPPPHPHPSSTVIVWIILQQEKQRFPLPSAMKKTVGAVEGSLLSSRLSLSHSNITRVLLILSIVYTVRYVEISRST